MNAHQRLEAIVSVVGRYLPPDGTPINEAMSEIIGLVDTIPPPQASVQQEPMADGMTLRDYFAAKAMQTVLAIEGGTYIGDAKSAYKAADAMMHIRTQAQPAPLQQEPVAWMQDSIELYVQDRPSAYYTIPLYTTPQAQPARQPLTDEQPNRWAVFCGLCFKEWSVPYQHPGKSVCENCEAAHSIKENT